MFKIEFFDDKGNKRPKANEAVGALTLFNQNLFSVVDAMNGCVIEN